MPDLAPFLEILNGLWLAGDAEGTAAFFAPDVVMLLPAGQGTMQGADSQVDGYRQFLEAAKIHDFEITAIDQHHWDGLSVCHLHFEVDYEVETGRFREKGIEVYTIDTSGEKPLVVWRHQLTIPATE